MNSHRKKAIEFLGTFEIYMVHIGDLESQLERVPKQLWEIIDYVGYGLAYVFVEKEGLKNKKISGASGEIAFHEVICFLLRTAWISGYLMYKVYKFEYIPPSNHILDAKKVRAIVEVKYEVNGNYIEIFLQRVIALHLENKPLLLFCSMIGDDAFKILSPHIDDFIPYIAYCLNYGVLSSRAEIELEEKIDDESIIDSIELKPSLAGFAIDLKKIGTFVLKIIQARKAQKS